ncbi:MAG TPA: TIGR01440 family protein [Firmicutes bacterium]|nr:TIGR01440 family protein [Bacillota bacterium]
MTLEDLQAQAAKAARELLDTAGLREGDILVVGCSSSEVGGRKIGTDSSPKVAQAVFAGIYGETQARKIFLAAQCCEHLNRAIILEREAAEKYGLEVVNVVPQPKAGGSFATAAYGAFREPAAVETVRARAGMDIGDTLIGMHLAPVAVPVRLSLGKIGEAHLVCARTRPKFIGGERAHYNPELL